VRAPGCAPAQGKQEKSGQKIKQTMTFKERLAEEAERFRLAAQELPYGTARELLLKRARQAETASHMNDWLSSPGLQSPK
jgi:hypothetical protein